MAVIVKLPFGSDRRAVDLRGLKVRTLRPTAPPGRRHPSSIIGAAIDDPVEGPGLDELCRGAASAAVVVPDGTRPISLPEVLPSVIGRLTACGVPAPAITVLVANGTHPPVGRDAIAELVGQLPDGTVVTEHDSRADGLLHAVGTTPSGLDVRLHGAVVGADVVVTVGSVRHHYFAGFGGGPKMIFPGVAGHQEIQKNHSRVAAVIDGTLRRHPGCEPGRLDGNPVAEEIGSAADLCPPDLAVCLVPDHDGGIAWAAAGPWRAAFGAAVEKTRDWYECALPEPARLVVASGGGDPGDRTLIQAHKGLDAACRFCLPGGEVLFLARLGGGAGSPDMEPFIADPRPDTILERLAESWVQYGHTTLRLVEKTAAYKVHLASDLDPDVSRRLGFQPTADPTEVIDGWRAGHPGEMVAVIPGAPVYPRARRGASNEIAAEAGPTV